MGGPVRLAADAFRTAFQVAPDLARELRVGAGLGIYDWTTPEFDGFELPESEELVLALHLGGSSNVRAVTASGLSRACSRPGLVTILPPHRRAAFHTAGAVRVMTLHLSARGQDDSLLARLAHVAGPRFALRDTYVTASMEALLRAARLDRHLPAEYAHKVADALVCHLSHAVAIPLVEHADPAAGERTSLAAVLAFIDANLGARLSIDELAARAGLGRARFTQLFRTTTGESAHRYLLLRRVEAAKRLLRETDRDLNWIAQETGFSSQSHFTGVFHAHTGMTPRRFRDGAISP